MKRLNPALIATLLIFLLLGGCISPGIATKTPIPKSIPTPVAFDPEMLKRAYDATFLIAKQISEEAEKTEMGNGVLIGEDLILTVLNILADKEGNEYPKIYATQDGRTYYKAQRVAKSSESVNLALLQIPKVNIQPLSLGDAQPRFLETLYIVGRSKAEIHPFVTSGKVVSTFQDGEGAVEIILDVVIEENGAGVINERGELVGIVITVSNHVQPKKTTVVRDIVSAHQLLEEMKAE